MDPEEGYVERYDICHETIQNGSFQSKKRGAVIGNSGTKQKRKQTLEISTYCTYDEINAEMKGIIYQEQEAGSVRLYELNPLDFPVGEKRRKIQKAINSHRYRQKSDSGLSAMKAEYEEKIRKLEERERSYKKEAEEENSARVNAENEILVLRTENYRLKRQLELNTINDFLLVEETENNFDFSLFSDVTANIEGIERLTWPFEDDSQTEMSSAKNTFGH